MSMSVLLHGFYTVHKHTQPQALFLDLLTFIKIIYHCGKNSLQSYPNHSYNTQLVMKRIYHLTDKLNLSLVLGGSLKRPDIHTMRFAEMGLCYELFRVVGLSKSVVATPPPHHIFLDKLLMLIKNYHCVKISLQSYNYYN